MAVARPWRPPEEQSWRWDYYLVWVWRHTAPCSYGTETGKKFQLANVKDVNYRTEETPSESENVNNSHAYEYDANGNLVYVNTSRTKKDGIADEKAA